MLSFSRVSQAVSNGAVDATAAIVAFVTENGPGLEELRGWIKWPGFPRLFGNGGEPEHAVRHESEAPGIVLDQAQLASIMAEQPELLALVVHFHGLLIQRLDLRVKAEMLLETEATARLLYDQLSTFIDGIGAVMRDLGHVRPDETERRHAAN